MLEVHSTSVARRQIPISGGAERRSRSPLPGTETGVDDPDTADHSEPDRPAHRWHVERASLIRADAEMMFVPARALPEAALGDTVEVTDDEGHARTGTIVDTTARDDEPFFRLDLRQT